MTEPVEPRTLVDLLQTLERSDNLRALARDCGLTVRELRRRLAGWRRELARHVEGDADAPAAPAAAPAPERTRARRPSWPELPAAADVGGNPLPATGTPVLEIFTDGASKGNPGPAGIGILFRQKDGEDLCAHSEAIGRATNNVAEYRAVLRALEFCRDWGVARIQLNLDSELIARQLNGAYRVKSPDLLPLYQQVVFLAREFKSCQVRHVRREQNSHADHLANVALRKTGSRRRGA